MYEFWASYTFFYDKETIVLCVIDYLTVKSIRVNLGKAAAYIHCIQNQEKAVQWDGCLLWKSIACGMKIALQISLLSLWALLRRIPL